MHRAALHGHRPGSGRSRPARRVRWSGCALVASAAPASGWWRRGRVAATISRLARSDCAGEPSRAFSAAAAAYPRRWRARSAASQRAAATCSSGPAAAAGAVPGTPVRVRLAHQRIVQRASAACAAAAFGGRRPGRRRPGRAGAGTPPPTRPRRSARIARPRHRRRGDAKHAPRAVPGPGHRSPAAATRRTSGLARAARPPGGSGTAANGGAAAAQGAPGMPPARPGTAESSASAAGQLDQGQRVPVRLGQHPVGQPRRQPGLARPAAGMPRG